MENMKYAPVVIPTLCRYEHFVRCVESLRKNTWAKYTDVYIGLDYPAKESHWDGYLRIKEYLKGSFTEFHSFCIIEQVENVGVDRNTDSLIDLCSQNHDRYIYVEDDLEFAPTFLQYMSTALQRYENDPDVACVVGYSYPLQWKTHPECTVVKQNFNGSAWGRGLWLSKRKIICKYLKYNGLCKDFSFAYRTNRFERMIDFAVKDYVSFCESGWSSQRSFLNTTTDVAMRIYLAVKDQYVVMPLISKVRNHGYDGSGLYCQRIEGNKTGDFCVDNYSFSEQPIDESYTFELVEDINFDMKGNRDLLNSFDRVSPEEMEVVWNKAEVIARLGRYGGVFFASKKVLKKAKRFIGVHK